MAQMNLSTKEKQIMAKESRLGVAGGQEGVGLDREFGIGGSKLLHLEWMGMGHTVQHRELCVIGSLCCTTEIEEIL